MAVNFDDLIDTLLENIALRGSQGATLQDITPCIQRIHDSQHADAIPRGKQNSKTTLNNPPPAPTVDDALCESVWSWLKAHPDLETKSRPIAKSTSHSQTSAPHPVHTKSPPTNAGDGSPAAAIGNSQNQEVSSEAPPKAPSDVVGIVGNPQVQQCEYLVADEHRVWLALAGHDRDPTRIAALNFDLLPIIASFGAQGVVQPRLVELSGQDKRSLPKRTDDLHRNGYIDKKRVIHNSTWTSLCTLKKFLPSNDEEQVPFESLSPDELRETIFRDGSIKIDMFIKAALLILGDHETVKMREFRQCLGLPAHRTERNMGNKILESMQQWGWLNIDHTANQNAPNGLVMRSVYLIHMPTAEEQAEFVQFWDLPRRIANVPEIGLSRTKTTLLHVDADTFQSTNVDTIPTKSRATTAWRPEQSLQYHFFEIVNAAGPEGIESWEIVDRLGFEFFKKTIEQITARLTDVWTVSQPYHLRHLAIVRDAALRGRQVHYVYRSYRNFNRAVQDGSVTWDAVTEQATPVSSGSLDCWGFTPISTQELLNEDYCSTLSECRRAVKDAVVAVNRSEPAVKRKERPPEVEKHVGTPLETFMARPTHETTPPKKPAKRIQPTFSPSSKKPSTPRNTKQWKTFVESTKKMAQIAASNEKVPVEEERNRDDHRSGENRPTKRARTSFLPELLPQNASELAPEMSTQVTWTGVEHQAATMPDSQASSHAVALDDAPGSTKRSLPDDEASERPRKVIKKKKTAAASRIERLHKEYTEMKRPGLYINPPQRLPVTIGRPRSRLIVVVKSNKLAMDIDSREIPPDPRDTETTVYREGSAASGSHEDSSSILPFSPVQHNADGREDANDSSSDQVERGAIQINDTEAVPAVPAAHRISEAPTHSSTVPNGLSEAETPHDPLLATALTATSKDPGNQTNGTTTPGDQQPLRQLEANRSQVPNDMQERPDLGTPAIGQSAGDVTGPQTGNPILPQPSPRVTKKKTGVTLSGGNLSHKRSKVLLNIIKEAGGVYPGDREIALPFVEIWQSSQANSIPMTDRETAQRAVRNLVDSRTLSKYFFAFRSRQGLVVTKSVLALADIGPTDQRVMDMRKRIEDFFPRSCRPGFEDNNADSDEEAPGGRQPNGHTVNATQRPKLPHTPSGNDHPELLANSTYQGIGRKLLPKPRASTTANLERQIQEIAEIAALEADVSEEQASMQSAMQFPPYNHSASKAYKKRSRLEHFSRRARLDAAVRAGFRSQNATGGPPSTVLQRTGIAQGAVASGSFSAQSLQSRLARARQAFKMNSGSQAGRMQNPDQPTSTPSSQFRPIAMSSARSNDDIPRPINHAATINPDSVSSGAVINHAGQELPIDLSELLRQQRKETVNGIQDPPSDIHDISMQEFQDVEDWELRNEILLVDHKRDKSLRFINHVASRTATSWLTPTQNRRGRVVRGGSSGRAKAPSRPVQPRNQHTQTHDRSSATIPRPNGFQSSEYRRARNKTTSQKKTYKVTEDEVRRLISCVTIVQLLAGGASRKLNWHQIQKVYDQGTSETIVRQKWKAVRLARADEVKQIRSRLQEAFLVAYQSGTLPSIDFDDTDAYDWEATVKWALGQWQQFAAPEPPPDTSHLKELVELPSGRQQFEDTYEIKKCSDRTDVVRLDITSMMHPARFTSEWLTVPFERNIGLSQAGIRPLPPVEAEPDKQTVIRSHVRANILTPEELYDSAKARDILSMFESRDVHESLQYLIDHKVVNSKGKGRHLPGRNQKSAERFNVFYNRHTLKGFPKILEEAVDYKTLLDAELSRDTAFDTEPNARASYYLRDGETLTLCNLLAAGRIELYPLTPPSTTELAKVFEYSVDASVGAADVPGRKLSIWGFTTKNYKTMHVEEGNIVFPIKIRPTADYVADIPPLEQSLMPPAAPTNSSDAATMQPLPAWSGIEGQLLKQMWLRIVGLVGTTLALLPGMNARSISAPMGVQAGFEEWEVRMVLEWMASKGLAKKLGTAANPKEQGWTTSEWWWSLVGAGEAIGTKPGASVQWPTEPEEDDATMGVDC